jgi:uncharacterized membrane protein
MQTTVSLGALEPCLEQMKKIQKFKFRQFDVPELVILIAAIVQLEVQLWKSLLVLTKLSEGQTSIHRSA